MKEKNQCALIIHGGAGNVISKFMTPEEKNMYEKYLLETLTLGHKQLRKGASALDVVETVIQHLESTTLFDAGKGSVTTSEGVVEMDAALMEGKEFKVGSVASIKTIKHPISLARRVILILSRVMEHTPHAMIFGEGAEKFGIAQGLETDKRYWEIIEERFAEGKSKEGLGTCGAVALDRQGQIASGLSTGGSTKKMPGRIGDVPIIGCGLYADNATCGVACTGVGEYFIRGIVAHSVSSYVEFKQMGIQEAVNTALKNKVASIGGVGGIIAISRTGEIGMIFNTPGMLRASVGFDKIYNVGID